MFFECSWLLFCPKKHQQTSGSVIESLRRFGVPLLRVRGRPHEARRRSPGKAGRHAGRVVRSAGEIRHGHGGEGV